MRVLALAGTAALSLTMPIAIAVVFVLAIVILSESRVIRAYPNGGGSYLVARENHGVIAGLVAASALLIDYVLTVAVSTAAGVAAISSFMPEIHPYRVPIGLGLIALLVIGNLRGVREAGLLLAPPPYLFVQVSTAIILRLAANTGFTGFPRLASVLANDRFMPRHFADVGSRLAFNTGIASLAVLAGVILAAFGGSVNALVPLYTIGVFLAFTLSQSGLVRRWWRLRNPGWRLSMVINSFGAAVTGTVLLVVAITKFQLGAWMVLLLLPLIVALLYSINRHYTNVQDALVISGGEQRLPVLGAPVVIVPVARIDRAALQALAFARSVSPNLEAVHVSTSKESAHEFQRRWEQLRTDIPLDIVESPFRSLTAPLLKYIDAIDKSDDRPITVVLSEFVPRHWWEWFLHSQTAMRLKASLLFRPNTIVIDVPYHSHDTGDLGPRPG